MQQSNYLHERPSFDQFFYLRLTEACNAVCDHCFIPVNPRSMSIGDAAGAISSIRSVASPGSRIFIQFHGGEPTILGVDTLTTWAESLIDGLPDYSIEFGIQTNLLRYDASLAAFVRRFCGNALGISWDPGIRKVRGSTANPVAEFSEIFWRNLESAKSDGLDLFMVMTATKQFFKFFNETGSIVEWALSIGISHIHIETLTKTGYAIENWHKIGVSNLEYSIGMMSLLDDYLQARAFGTKVFISPFDGLMESVGQLGSGQGGYGCLSGACDTTFHTIDGDGYKKGCTALTASPSDDVQVVQLIDLEAERASRRTDCGTCNYRSVCSSGCLASDIDDGSGECSGHRLLFEKIRNHQVRKRA